MADYDMIVAQTEAMTENGNWYVTVLANLSALIMESFDGLNWAGFYIMKDGALVLGPFQGKPACTHIEIGKGVCGTDALTEDTQLVYDVHEFPGHIACDSASNSEIVIPLFAAGKVWGVLDIDSPFTGRFTEEDREGLERMAAVIESYLEKELKEGNSIYA